MKNRWPISFASRLPQEDQDQMKTLVVIMPSKDSLHLVLQIFRESTQDTEDSENFEVFACRVMDSSFPFKVQLNSNQAPSGRSL